MAIRERYSNLSLREITQEDYVNASDIAHEINWYAVVTYQDNSIRYFVFDEPYNVKISDFFDRKGENAVKHIELS